jgi:hypothetical protein
MFEYVEDKQFVSRMRSLCGEVMQVFCHILKEEYNIGAQFYLAGSGAKKKNLIMQNGSEAIDLDYNLQIVRCENFDNCRNIKESVRKAFNKALHKFRWGDCEDSTSSLTTKKRHFTQGNDTEFSMDVCIVRTGADGNLKRLIHDKTGWTTCYGEYYWKRAPNSKNIKKKVEYIKKNGKWELVRIQYKDIKNEYLRRNDHDHPSFVCYIEAVNNVYNSIKHW